MLNSIYDHSVHITELSQKQLEYSKQLIRYCYECDCTKLMSTAEKALCLSSESFSACRELLLFIYSAVPTLPHAEIEDIQNKVLNVSVETFALSGFNAYRIALPFLLPNKRRKSTDFKNAITVAVSDAVRRFCLENGVKPFDRASVFFVSYYRPESSFVSIVDNDNKESSMIQNAMIGSFLRDDQATVCDTYYCSKVVRDSYPKTEIYVVGSEHDVEVLSFIKAI